MVKKSQISAQDDSRDSLIPAIRAEEIRLQEVLAETQTQTTASVDRARREAEELVEEARTSQPAWIETQRDKHVEQVQVKTDQRRESRPQRLEALRELAGRNRDAAVECILSAVLGTSE